MGFKYKFECFSDLSLYAHLNYCGMEYLSTEEIHQHNGQQNWTEHRTKPGNPETNKWEKKQICYE